MFSTSIPTKLSIPWGNSAAAGTIRPIPTASQIGTQPGAASLTDGFPPLNGIPVSAGGIPPFQQDMNGILNRVTAWIRWLTSGGAIGYDAAYSVAIGGYPAGALVQSTSGHAWFENLVDSNTTDPNAGGANWKIAASVWSSGTFTAGGSANAQIITLVPAAASFVMLRHIAFTFLSVGTSTAAVTLNVNGLGPLPLLAANGTTLSPGALVTGGFYQVLFDGTSSFRLLSPISVFTDPGDVSLTLGVAGTTASGANLALFGNGATTPNKFIRAVNGALQIVNSAFSSTIMSLTDTGALNTIGSITAGTGNITAAGGRLRAGLGARGAGDFQAGVIRADFTEQPLQNGFTLFPNNLVLQWQVAIVNASGVLTTTLVPTPISFPQIYLASMISYVNNNPPAYTSNPGLAATPNGLSQTSVIVGPNSIATTFGVNIWSIGF